MESNRPVLTLRYREDMLEMEFEEWLEKVKSIHSQLEENFDNVIISYTFSNSKNTKIVDKVKFYNLLKLELVVHNQEHD